MARNKELTCGSGPEVDSYGIRPEGDVSKVTRIGNRVVRGAAYDLLALEV